MRGDRNSSGCIAVAIVVSTRLRLVVARCQRRRRDPEQQQAVSRAPCTTPPAHASALWDFGSASNKRTYCNKRTKACPVAAGLRESHNCRNLPLQLALILPTFTCPNRTAVALGQPPAQAAPSVSQQARRGSTGRDSASVAGVIHEADRVRWDGLRPHRRAC